MLVTWVSSPKTVHLTITTACNWNCIFCTAHEEKSPKFYPKEKIVRIIKILAESGVNEISLYGGEPSLHPNFLEFGKEIKEHGVCSGFISNGFGIKEETVDKILDYFDHGGISIHGFRKEHDLITRTPGSFVETIRAIELLDREGFKIALQTTITTLNLFSFPKFIRWMFYKFPSIAVFVINRGTFTGKNKRFCLNRGEIVELVTKVKELKDEGIPVRLGVPIPPCILPNELRSLASFCSAGIEFADVDGEGNVYICGTFRKETYLGNIFEKSMSEIWNSDKALYFRTFNWADSRCLNCKYFEDCFCGCKLLPQGGYGVDPISKEKMTVYLTLHPLLKKRKIDNSIAVSQPYSLSVLFHPDLCFLLDYLREPREKDEIIKILCNKGITRSKKEAVNLLTWLVKLRILIIVYRKNIEDYIIPGDITQDADIISKFSE